MVSELVIGIGLGIGLGLGIRSGFDFMHSLTQIYCPEIHLSN